MSWIVENPLSFSGKGYWEPHTSSVDFCESNYLWSPYIAEFHNSWSSLMISFFGLLGILYGNPTNEWRFFICYIVLISIGLGSFLLHMTLHWIPQSSDEVPMLWLMIACLYSIIEAKSPIGKSKSSWMPWLFLAGTAFQTFIYYKFQAFYFVFLFSFISIVTVNTLFCYSFIIEKSMDSNTKRLLFDTWLLGFVSFVIVGAGLWIIDMNFCKYLVPFYEVIGLGGATLHIIWHITAGYAAYLLVNYIGIVRVYNLNYPSKLTWILKLFPIWTRNMKKAIQ